MSGRTSRIIDDIGTGAQAAVDAQAGDLQIEPADDARHLLALRRLGRQQDLPAQRGVAFQQHHVMAALGADARRFHARRPGAHHHHPAAPAPWSGRSRAAWCASRLVAAFCTQSTSRPSYWRSMQ